MSTFQCPSCQQSYHLKPELAGKRIRCAKCQNVFAVPPAVSEPSEIDPLGSGFDDPLGGFGDLSDEGPALGSPTAPRSAPTTPRRQSFGGVSYEIHGAEMQYCELTLDPGQTVIAEAGGMMCMSAGITMETVLGDPNAQNQGFLGKIASAGKRAMTGESLFMTKFTNSSSRKEMVCFAAPIPGKILPVHLDDYGGQLICQKDSFLCGTMGVEVGIAFQKRIGAGLFGGEGFIMQRLSGRGLVMIQGGGTMMQRQLSAGEKLKLDTGCLMAISSTVNYNIEMVGGLKNAFFGGEGLFLATLTGPGHVWIQSLPFSRLAGRMMAGAPQNGGSRGEGSLLGTVGNMLMGDNG
ncbi:MAG: TIGR00266 family protein [Planctomycetales bacterium]|nr:TIGR00266 family protein [Planctomycetales bacterium]